MTRPEGEAEDNSFYALNGLMAIERGADEGRNDEYESGPAALLAFVFFLDFQFLTGECAE